MSSKISADELVDVTGYLLTRAWRDRPDGIEISLWVATDAGALQVIVNAQQAVCKGSMLMHCIFRNSVA